MSVIFGRILCLNYGAVLLLLIQSTDLSALVLHPDDDPNASWMDRPHPAVVGRWGSNASCVAIAPDYVLTRNHQGGGINTTVYFDSILYKANEEWRVPAGLASADLRVCRIETTNGEPANLCHYTPPLTGPIDIGTEVVLGGFGDGRGATLTTNDIPYGYLHDTSQNNAVQR